VPAVPDAALPDATPTALPALLSQTGIERGVPFAPRHALWSDAAVKERLVALPDGATIDATDPDRWRFPIGTRFWKTFSLDGRKLETRVIWQVANTGDPETATLFGAYLWNDDETEATFSPAGGQDLRGTTHDAPAATDCLRCHVGEPGRALGYTAIQLPALDDVPLAPPPTRTYDMPNLALGYLHANCGHCHSPQGGAWASSSVVLRILATEDDPASNGIVATTVRRRLQAWLGHGFDDRIVAGDPDRSAILFRMGQRTPNMQMPPIATELVDPVGVALVRDWIQSL